MNKSKRRKQKFKKKGSPSNVQHRYVVAPKDYRKKKYMRDPEQGIDTSTYYPDRKNKY